MLINPLKKLLIENQPCFVFAVRSVQNAGIVGIAQSAGYQGIYIDIQHSATELSSAANIYQSATHAGLTALTRIPHLDPTLIGRIIDSGGHGIMLADVRYANQAEELVSAALLHPEGQRSLGMPIDPRFHELSGINLTQSINANTLLIAMIESVEGIQNVTEIVRTSGIDAIQIGSADLTASIGIPGEYGHPRLLELYTEVSNACRLAQKPFIIGGIRDVQAMQPYLSMGAAKCFFTGSDTAFIRDGAQRARLQLLQTKF